MKSICCLFVLGAACVAGAAGIPKPILPEGVGVNIHFVTGHERDLDRIAQAGFKFVRMDFGWAGIETSKNIYNWSEYDQLVANLEKRGLSALFILDYSNPLFESTVASTNPITRQREQNLASPQHPESVAAFARWAAAAAGHYQGRPVIWEIWNEPNIQFWSPKPDVQQYTALALATCKAMRAAQPSATIIGPATSEFPWEFLETFMKSGVLEYLDAVSVHPYRPPGKPPETAATDYARLRKLIDRYTAEPKKGRLPIVSGEWGYSTCTKGVSLERQAAFAARQQLFNLLQGVPLSIWYDWKNDGDDSKENEHNFGTVLPDLSPKPAYTAIQTLTRELAGYRIVQRLALASEEDYALDCQNAEGKRKIAAWTVGQRHTARLPVQGALDGSLAAVNSKGEGQVARVAEGLLNLDLGEAPQYVTIDGKKP